jgi:hypothetical protein
VTATDQTRSHTQRRYHATLLESVKLTRRSTQSFRLGRALRPIRFEGRRFPLVFHEGDDLQFAGDRADAVDHLASIGLLRGDDIGVVAVYTREERLGVTYFGESRLVDVRAVKPENRRPHYSERPVPMGRFEFTKMGLELSKIAGAEPLTDFWDRVAPLWNKRGIVLLR